MDGRTRVADLVAEVQLAQRSTGRNIVYVVLELADERELTIWCDGRATIRHPDGRTEEGHGEDVV